MSDTTADRDPFKIVAESFLARYRAGERPSIDEFASRHPELADQIRRLLPALVMIERDLRSAGDTSLGRARPVLLGAMRQLGDYRILREVGREGMGVVYEAEQISLGRRVALKVLPNRVTSDGKALERFRREAKAAARLHHTNIVPVFEVGLDGEAAYYAMQFIEGQPLDQVIDEVARLRAANAKPTSIVERERAHGEISGTTFANEPTLSQTVDALLHGRFTEATVRLSNDENSVRPSDSSSGQTKKAMLPGGSKVSTGSLSARWNSYYRSVAQIGRQASQGLAYAHSSGILHRDIKPSNLLLDHTGVIWITDFGLAKAQDDGLTQTGDILGTLHYMAPCRFRGEGDARADVYALGLTLYELLALRPAFESNDRLQLIERIKNEEPSRLRTIDPRIPRDLETIVRKAIEKDPAAGYQSAEALGEDLRRFLADEPILARQVNLSEHYWRWARRNPGVAALSGVLATVLLLGFVVMAVLLSRAEQSAETARRNEDTAKSLAQQEAIARGEASALALKEKAVREHAETQERVALEKTENLQRADYIKRVNRAYREIQDDNIALAEDLLHGCDPNRRGWEWHYVERLCNSSRAILDLGNTSINAVDYSPDGSSVVIGSSLPVMSGQSNAETTVDVWRTSGEPNRRPQKLPGAKGKVHSVKISPDGKLAAAGFSDGLIILWDIATGSRLWSRFPPGLSAMSVAFSPNGQTLAVGYGRYSGIDVGRVQLWDVAKGNELAMVEGPRGGVNSVAYDRMALS